MTPILGILDSAKTGNLATPAWDFINSYTVSGSSTNSFTMNSIPQTYKHLQIRTMNRCGRSNTNAPLWVNANSDTTSSNYTTIYFYTFQTTANVDQAWSTTEGGYSISGAGDTAAANVFGGGYMTLYNYTDTNKYKNGKGLSGINNQNSGDQVFGPIYSVWKNTAAITSLTFRAFQFNFNAGTTVALYGLKG